MGLEPDAGASLQAAAVPRYLMPPVPVTWLASDNCPTNLPRRPGQAGVGAGTAQPYDPTWDKALHLLPDKAA